MALEPTTHPNEARRLGELTRRYARFSVSAGGLGSVLGGVLVLVTYFVGALVPDLSTGARIAMAAAPLVWIGAKELFRSHYYQRLGRVAVVEVEDSLPDNVPGQFDDQLPLGNHVILDHGNDESSFLAHLRQGSVTAHSGEQVSAGTVLGQCGNSGRSSEPHLHYHLQNGPGFGAGAGLPAQFQNYYADGQLVDRGEPQQGQLIEAANAEE